MHVDERRTAGEISDLGNEIAGAHIDDRRRVPGFVAPCDCGRPRNQNNHPGARPTRRHELRPPREATDRAKAAQSVDFRRRQFGEHLLAAGFD